MLTDFYIAFSPACFALPALWLAIIAINARAWLTSQHSHRRQRQAYIVALYFAAPGTMSLLALINPLSTFVWRVFFIIVSVLGIAGMLLFGPFPSRNPRHLLDASDQAAHWIAVGLYLAVAALAFTPLRTERVEAVLLTVLILLGVHVALRLMFAVGEPAGETSAAEPGPR
jgi:prepilin signal peptidase PulO-like enzyme (type II secretory pathway)